MRAIVAEMSSSLGPRGEDGTDLEVGDGFDFTIADFRSWCSEAGSRCFAVLPLGGPASAAIAYK